MTEKPRELRFLVVDDNEDIRDVFCRLVERAGHVASTASDGQEAVETLQGETFDVMLLDLTMPRMNGVDVVRWLRAHPDVAPDLKIVVISAWAGEHRAVLQELGIVALHR
jgi:CheY-like chemotaxis protein